MNDVQSILTQSFSINSADIEKSQSFQKKYGGRLEHILVNMGALSEDALPQFYAEFLQLAQADDDIVAGASFDAMQDNSLYQALLPLNWFLLQHDDQQCTILAKDPLSAEGNQLISQLQQRLHLFVLTEPQLQQLKQKSVRQSDNLSELGDELSDLEEDRLRELADEAPTVNLLNSLIARALKSGASDMHLEPSAGRYRVRFRIDGVLQEADFLAPRMRLPIASRIKILSGMDIAEKRRPQDGKIAMKIANEELDIRVSALPLHEGESIVMRFLRQDSINYSMEVLGLSADIEQYILQDLKKTAGVILLTGPTGSGKTTSLYTFLNAINQPEVKIITLEDPVEYQLEGVNQVQVQPSIGFDFSAGLRSIVRQDPDVIMVGEIRDNETAQIAMQSALTGHLVFSTVHTNDAPSAYTRLLDLGAQEYLLNAAIVSIIAQRLARKLCPHCKQPAENAAELIQNYQLEQLASRYQLTPQLYQPKGCDHCAHTGYKGRMAVVEYLRCDDDIKALPKDENFPQKARELGRAQGNRTLLQDGLLKAIQGLTTVEEVIRVAG
ncbi:GspE/PulE family protein [Alkalimonas collagenimarina]|uniref:GspE/PulE family protein n=1 Tax=Alkalimonas collagenimarina TaxID=400390 RepID=A0ABT9H0P9_9GAMM|nr:GspE/PulE family protein [Alkalimonas collagenimarina]MDP4536900.1 GspE/PulE family protein [Alkalimonas collagenimarina]